MSTTIFLIGAGSLQFGFDTLMPITTDSHLGEYPEAYLVLPEFHLCKNQG